ncbi:MAG: hypothetical protein U1E16_00050 [Hyphomicrobiales bacterium]
MRALSAELLEVQSHPDALATVTVRCKRRSTLTGDPLLWRPLFKHTSANLPYGDPHVTAAACACAQGGTILRVLRSAAAGKIGVQRFTVTNWTGSGTSWPSAATSALTAAPVPVAALTSSDAKESTPGAGRIGSEIRVLYGDGGKLYCVRSTDDGVSWGAPVVAYDGGLNYLGFNNISVNAYGSTWLCVCNGYNTKGIPVVLGFHDAGGGWVTWREQHPANYGHWQVAGVRPGPEAAPNCRAYVYLYGTDYDAAGTGWNSLACQGVQVNSSGVFTAWGSRTVVDRAGVAGAAAYDRVRFGEGGGAYLFAMQERAAAGYWFVASLYALPGNADMEEPVFLGPADTPAGGGTVSGETLQPLAGGRRAWLVGAGEVWASAQSDAALDLAERTYTPTTYRCDVTSSGGGVLQLELARQGSALPSLTPSAGPAVEGFGAVYPPDVYVGDMLWLDRTLSVGAASGTQSLAFRVAAVTYRRDTLAVLALDALGVLAHMRPRRAKVLMKNDRLRMADVEAICHWAGLTTKGTGTLPNAVYPSPGFLWSANESGLGAMWRYLADQAVALRSDGADVAQDHTRIEFLPLPLASSYTYVSPHGLAEGYGTHEIADWALTHDGRETRLFVAVGLRAGASATTGEAWAMAGVRAGSNGARPPDGVRPAPYVAVDRSMAWADGSLAARVAAEAAKLAAGLSFGWIEAAANLGIELYDVVTVDATDVRVVGITETWDRGRLRQRLELAEVNSFGVWQG